jgi:NAD(P)-dependent dehydrogenase (short-subunit alcohol dehydrogenase family)
MRLDGKVAIITGAAGGIGRGCAEAFAREGAWVVLADQNVDAGDATAHALVAAGRRAAFVHVDVAEPDSVEQLVRRTVELYGQLDVLVSNAGIGGRQLGDGPTHLCSVEAWDRILQVNLRGTFLACKFAIPQLLKRGGGSIVTMASVLGLVGTQGLFDTHAYVTSKAGIIGLTRAIAAHYARERVRANVIAPGLIDTQMAARTKADPALYEQVAFWQPLGPLGQVRDVADAAVFLASDESRFITGVVLPVDGGWSVQ